MAFLMIVSGSAGNTLNSFYKLVTESLKKDDETNSDSMEEGDHSVLAMEIQERFHGASRFYTFSVCKLVFLRPVGVRHSQSRPLS